MRKPKLILILLAAVLIFTSCRGNGGSDSTDNDKGGVITLQMRECDSFNPLTVTHHSTRDVLSLCYEPLFRVNDTIEAEGVLAQSIDISDDCMTAIINLKDSVLWHDGIKFTSNDVIHTMSLLKDNPNWEYSDCVRYIDSAVAIDALSLKINLTKPYGQIAHSLTFPIVPYTNEELDSKIVGTGPYMFSAYTPSTVLELVKNTSWHGGESICKKINISIIRDNDAATTAFNTGLLSAVTDNSFDLENNTPRINTKTHSYPTSEFEYMALNHNRGVFVSQAVRSAVSYAIDRSDIVQNCYQNEAVAVNAPIHPSAQNVTESSILSQYSLVNASEMLFLEGYTLDENTRLLKDGNGNVLSFSILVNEENLPRTKTAEVLAKHLFAAGIDARVVSLPFDEYLERIKNGEFDAYLGGARLRNFYDFEALLREGGSLNNYGYKSEFMDLALNAINSSRGNDSLSDALFNFEEVFLREQPILGLVFRNRVLLTSENIKGEITTGVNTPYKNIHSWSVN